MGWSNIKIVEKKKIKRGGIQFETICISVLEMQKLELIFEITYSFAKPHTLRAHLVMHISI